MMYTHRNKQNRTPFWRETSFLTKKFPASDQMKNTRLLKMPMVNLLWLEIVLVITILLDVAAAAAAA